MASESDKHMPIAPPASQPGTAIACSISEGFAAWLASAHGSLAITTYQAGKVALVGSDGSQATLLMREFDKPLGMAVEGQRIALATRHELLVLANAPLLARDYLEQQPGRYDAIYLPRVAYLTGDLNIHDVAWGRDGAWITATRFSCLARLSKDFNFVPAWQPKFVSELAPEDRCHLNGLAMRDGKPAFVTALGESDKVGGWREQKVSGGILIDVESQEIALRGLSMPHSPRWHEGRLWLLNSGTGELWITNPQHGTHDVVCSLPGYLRGLSFVGRYALVGLCQIRERHIFSGLPVQEKHSQLLCGVAAVDLASGRLVGMLEFTSGCQEIYDLAFLPGVLRPTLLNRGAEASRQAFTAPEFAYWLRASSLLKDREQLAETHE